MTEAEKIRLAWPLEHRREDMRREVKRASEGGWIAMIRPIPFAETYGQGKILPCEVEAEMMRHLQEGCDK